MLTLWLHTKRPLLAIFLLAYPPGVVLASIGGPTDFGGPPLRQFQKKRSYTNEPESINAGRACSLELQV